ncbi:fiber [Tree shrew adenovirus 1]|uniref:fiber n=1 Tax=Tree shrew adenovirus serotype 1 TaxID=47680 RepID=UPI00001D97AE|nr:fiber [Tree shrew adenovirus 1]
MKRRASPINPVYPYGAKKFIIPPPFISENGFKEEPWGVLNLDIKPPLTFEDTQLTVKVGSGLTVGSDGSLQGGSAANIAVTPPLQNDAGNIKLKTGVGLDTSNGSLNVSLQGQNGIQVADDVVSAKLGAGLTVDGNDNIALDLTADSPLSLSNNTLSLNTGKGLATTPNGQLVSSLTTSLPLTLNNDQLELGIGDGLHMYNDQLAAHVQNPLKIENGKIDLKIGSGLHLNANDELEADGMSLTPQAPLSLNNSTLSLNVGAGLNTVNDALAVQTQGPLKVENGQIGLKIGTGLRLNSNEELEADGGGGTTFTPQAPLALNNNTLSLSLGDGLTTSNNALTLQVSDPIILTSHSMALNLGGGLVVKDRALWQNVGPGLVRNNNLLTLNIADPLGWDTTNVKLTVNLGGGLEIAARKLQVNVGRGLMFSGTTVAAKLGTGLSFGSNNEINVTAAGLADYTLWTTSDPSPNVNGSSNLSCKMWLTLTNMGGVVVGTMAIRGVGGTDVTIASGSTARDFTLYFNSQGNLTTNSDLVGTFGFRQGQSINPNSSLNKLKLMPNTNAYPPGYNNYVQSYYVTTAYLSGNTSKPLLVRVGYNTLLQSGYSIEFKINNLNNYIGQNFELSTITFSYMSQE